MTPRSAGPTTAVRPHPEGRSPSSRPGTRCTAPRAGGLVSWAASLCRRASGTGRRSATSCAPEQDPAQLIAELAAQRPDKHNPTYYAERTVRRAAAALPEGGELDSPADARPAEPHTVGRGSQPMRRQDPDRPVLKLHRGEEEERGRGRRPPRPRPAGRPAAGRSAPRIPSPFRSLLPPRRRGLTMPPSAKQETYYQRFAEEIIQRIQEGTAPWQKPWKPGDRPWLPENMASGRAYTGGNTLYLAVAADRRGLRRQPLGDVPPDQGARRTCPQRRNRRNGSSSLRGTKGAVVRGEDGKPKRDAAGDRIHKDRLVWRTFTVFNAEQTSGLNLARPTTVTPAWLPHQRAEAVIASSGVDVRHKHGDRAFYDLKRDHVVLPERVQFPSADHYYQTALHELGHATGHEARLNRQILQDAMKAGFGSPAYAREELRAEISAMMTGQRLGVGHDPARGAAYVEGWVAALKDDPREIHRASADSQRISNHLIDRARDRLEGIEKTLAEHGKGMRPEISGDRSPAPERPAPERSR